MKYDLRPDLRLSQEALNDLDDILQYTLATWGVRQAELYRDKLKAGLGHIHENPQIGYPRDDITLGCRVFQIEKHQIIYRDDPHVITILRIVHLNRLPFHYGFH